MSGLEVREGLLGSNLDAVLPYVKALTADPAHQLNRFPGLMLANRAFVGSLVTTYVVNKGGLQFVSEQDLTTNAISVDECFGGFGAVEVSS